MGLAFSIGLNNRVIVAKLQALQMLSLFLMRKRPTCNENKPCYLDDPAVIVLILTHVGEFITHLRDLMNKGFVAVWQLSVYMMVLN